MSDTAVQTIILDDTDPRIQYSEGWIVERIRQNEVNQTSHVAQDDGVGFVIEFTDDGEDHFTIVDDNDPTVEYSDDWSFESLSLYGYNGTTHKSNSTGSVATFSFSGTSIEVYGTVRGSNTSSTPLISFQVDEMEKESFYSRNGEGYLFPKLRLYSGESLSPEMHTLRIESLMPTEFWIDYFLYQSSPSLTSSSAQSRKTRTAAIAGAVVGAIAGLALVLFILLLFYRHIKASRAKLDRKSHSGSKYCSYTKSKSVTRTHSLSGSTCLGVDNSLYSHYK
ncbi:hypothetical protein CPB86DRAFT_800842 [Serendipita vermifera]|nr:hypothetical protein CPB86DRAFT_800842 [Serendipita vermifera]